MPGRSRSGVCSAAMDVADPFHQFKCAALASLFGLGFQATVREMVTMFAVTIDTVYDDKKADQVPVPEGEILKCCSLAIMGWS